jgi:hypothetical protein
VILIAGVTVILIAVTVGVVIGVAVVFVGSARLFVEFGVDVEVDPGKPPVGPTVVPSVAKDFSEAAEVCENF